MASLALAAAVVMLSVWGLAALSLICSFLGFRFAGAVTGALSFAAGLWLLCVLPHVPFLGAVNLVAGGVAVWRYFGGDHERQ
jgi:hypothetical protein